MPTAPFRVVLSREGHGSEMSLAERARCADEDESCPGAASHLFPSSWPLQCHCSVSAVSHSHPLCCIHRAFQIFPFFKSFCIDFHWWGDDGGRGL